MSTDNSWHKSSNQTKLSPLAPGKQASKLNHVCVEGGYIWLRGWRRGRGWRRWRGKSGWREWRVEKVELNNFQKNCMSALSLTSQTLCLCREVSWQYLFNFCVFVLWLMNYRKLRASSTKRVIFCAWIWGGGGHDISEISWNMLSNCRNNTVLQNFNLNFYNYAI